MLALFWVWWLMSAAVPSQLPGFGGCSTQHGAMQPLADALAAMHFGETDRAKWRLREGLDGTLKNCPQAWLALLAIEGWEQARALAAHGGPVSMLGPVRETLAALGKLSGDAVFDLQREYAHTVIQAAIAAAQDERPEMQLLLDHARDLTERLRARHASHVWPLPFNYVAGELWFEVDRFEEASRAYERAVLGSNWHSPRAVIGLARAEARLGLKEHACRVLARAKDVPAALLAAAMERDLAHCR